MGHRSRLCSHISPVVSFGPEPVYRERLETISTLMAFRICDGKSVFPGQVAQSKENGSSIILPSVRNHFQGPFVHCREPFVVRAEF
eukprot:4490815-Pyramimonas_sp.AAC.1